MTGLDAASPSTGFATISASRPRPTNKMGIKRLKASTRFRRRADRAVRGVDGRSCRLFLWVMPKDEPAAPNARKPPRLLLQTEAEKAAREERLAAALRANLHRRKAQLRARKPPPGDGSEG